MRDKRSIQRTGAATLQISLAFWLSIAFALATPLRSEADEAQPSAPSPHAVLLEVDGAIGPAVQDYLRRSLKQATETGATVAIIQLDTPGGLVDSTREILRDILDSPIPVAVYVAPQGARAASAGTYLVYASHIAAMAPATHLGAATPVQLGGGGGSPFSPDSDRKDAPEKDDGSDEGNRRGTAPPADAMTRKITNDAAAYIRTLAELRGRNAEWAESAVREAATLTASEALDKNVIDLIATDVPTLLSKMDGKTVVTRDRSITLATAGLPIVEIQPDWRTRFLSIIANPNVAYIFLMLGIYGLFFEFANPGTYLPGVAGAILLLLGLFALQQLPINYAGFALIILGIALMVAEALTPSFGALGIGGVISFAIGSVILVDTDVPGFELSWSVIAAFSAASAVMFIMMVTMAMKAWKRPVVSGHEAMIGSIARAAEDFEQEGWVNLQGESWKARSSRPVRRGEAVKVTEVNNLQLAVEPAVDSQSEKPTNQSSP